MMRRSCTDVHARTFGLGAFGEKIPTTGPNNHLD